MDEKYSGKYDCDEPIIVPPHFKWRDCENCRRRVQCLGAGGYFQENICVAWQLFDYLFSL